MEIDWQRLNEDEYRHRGIAELVQDHVAAIMLPHRQFHEGLIGAWENLSTTAVSNGGALAAGQPSPTMGGGAHYGVWCGAPAIGCAHR